jgi:hypothetical protein
VIRACPLGRCGSTRHRRAGICSPSFVRLHDRDRPRRLASHEDLFPSANQAETRCPCCHASDDPALALVARFMPEGIPYSMQSCVSPMRFFAGVSIASPKIGVRPESPENAGRGIMHRQFPSWRCSAIRRPCSAVPRYYSGASPMGFDPSQSCSCPQAAGCFHHAGPTCRLLSVRPGLRFFCREINRLLPS